MTKGRYIVIEGQDGTGKTTQVNLLAEYFRAQGQKVTLVNESAKNNSGLLSTDALINVFLNRDFELDPLTNVLVITAVRLEIWKKIILPTLEQGGIVFSTRNWFSTLAYQHFGQGVDRETVEQITRKFLPERYVHPDFSVILTLSDEGRLKRIKTRNNDSSSDAFESQPDDFQTRVNTGYLEIAKLYDIDIIDASGAIDEILIKIKAMLETACPPQD
ncbi:MAG: dTMP kinase [Candidatus Nomurabacteria bacterium]|jgi:dTMP kinase|nr:dTMP kinase [Candidatus Nomurabacteria bacterium]